MERVVRRMNGVSPEDADSSSVSGLGSENRTRFLDLLGVAGGVDMLWHPDFEARGLIREQRFGPSLVLLFLLAATGRSSSVVG
jgi:hypothetical protein